MTTPPVDGEPPADIKDPTAVPSSGSPDDADNSGNDTDTDSDSGDTDAMGIDDNDPIDATLVGEPVDRGDSGEAGDGGGATSERAGDADAGSESE